MALQAPVYPALGNQYVLCRSVIVQAHESVSVKAPP